MSNTFVEPWTEARVQDIASDAPRSITIGPFGSRLKAELYVADGFPVIRGQDIGPGKGLLEDNLVYVPEAVAESLSGCIVSEGDLIFPHRGAIGQVGIVGQRQFLLSSSMMKLTCNRTVIDPGFLFYYFRGPGRGELLTRASTVGTPGIGQPLKSLRGIPIRYPGLPQQRAIAEVLGALDDKIAANTTLVQTSDELAGVLTRHALDFENRVPLSSVAIVTMGSSPLGATLNEVGDGEVFYQGVRDFGVRFPANRVWTTGPVRFAEMLDTLLSVRAPVGRANLAQERTCIGRGIASIWSTEAHPYSIFHRLRDDPEIWAPYEAEGTVFGSINRRQLDTLAMPSILADDSDRLEAQLAAIELRVASALAENRTLAATRDALLPQLMSGKLRVRDAEKVVEAVV